MSSPNSILATEIIEKAQSHIQTLTGRKWPDIQRILEAEEEIKVSFAVTLTNRDTAPGEHADKSNHIKTTISFSERFSDSVDEELTDPEQPLLPLGGRTKDAKPNPESRAASLEAPEEPEEKHDAAPPATSEPGQTSLADAFDEAASGATVATLDLNLETREFDSQQLIRAFKATAKKAKWPAACISLLSDRLKECETVTAMIDTLRPHVIGTDQPSDEEPSAYSE